MTIVQDRSREGLTESSTGAFHTLAPVMLLPVSIVALGSPEQPIDRLMALQSAVGRGVHFISNTGRIRLSLSADGWPRLQLR